MILKARGEGKAREVIGVVRQPGAAMFPSGVMRLCDERPQTHSFTLWGRSEEVEKGMI